MPKNFVRHVILCLQEKTGFWSFCNIIPYLLFIGIFVAGNATYKSPCRSVGRSVLSPLAFFTLLGISRVGKFVFEHAPAQIVTSPAQFITAPAQIITAPAQIITAPAQPPATEQSRLVHEKYFSLCNLSAQGALYLMASESLF